MEYRNTPLVIKYIDIDVFMSNKPFSQSVNKRPRVAMLLSVPINFNYCSMRTIRVRFLKVKMNGETSLIDFLLNKEN